MFSRVVHRSALFAAVLLLSAATIASADTVAADGDLVAPGNNGVVDLGALSPGASVTFDVGFELVCRGSAHPDAGTTIAVSHSSSIVPEGGAIAVDAGAIGPIPSTWPPTGTFCSGAPTLLSSTPAHVTITAPTLPGDDYPYTLLFAREPAGGLSGSTMLSVVLDVVGNTPPVLSLPDDLAVEGDTHGGWTASFTASANDTEDDPDPAVTCAPAPGDLLPLGTTTVACSAVDGGGLAANGTFEVTVVDTQAPTLSGMSSDRTVATGSSAAVVTFAAPSALDVVDANPDVSCSPASGSTFPLGATTVTCTAADGSGNASSASFVVTVVQVSALFDEPVGADGMSTVNSSRTLPIKARLALAGADVTGGSVWLWVGPCGGSGAPVTALSRQGDRWMTHLEVEALSPGCHAVTIRVDGLSYGGFELHVTGKSSPSGASKPSSRRN